MIVLVTVGRRSAAPDDPVALPARRLRVPRRRLGRAPRSRADGVTPERAELLGAPRRRTARPRARARRSPRPGAGRVRRRRQRSRRQRGRGRARRPSWCRTRSRRRVRARGRAGRRGRAARRPSSRRPGTPSARGAAQLRRLEEQHKRAHRRARTDALLEGITALETVYRDALAGPGRRAAQPRPRAAGRCRRGAAAAALDACREARQAIAEFNPNETLLVERLLLHLPPADAGSRSPSGDPRRTRYTRRRAGVAQTAEQLTRNEQAKGSSPFSGSTRRIEPRRVRPRPPRRLESALSRTCS